MLAYAVGQLIGYALIAWVLWRLIGWVLQLIWDIEHM